MSTSIFTRKLQKVSSHSYSINIPKEIIDQLGWRERQKVDIILSPQSSEIIIKDWQEPKQK